MGIHPSGRAQPSSGRPSPPTSSQGPGAPVPLPLVFPACPVLARDRDRPRASEQREGPGGAAIVSMPKQELALAGGVHRVARVRELDPTVNASQTSHTSRSDSGAPRRAVVLLLLRSRLRCAGGRNSVAGLPGWLAAPWPGGQARRHHA